MAPSLPPQTFYTQVPDTRSSNSAHVTLQSQAYPITLRTPAEEDIPGLTSVMSNPANTGSDLSVSKMSEKEITELVSKWQVFTSPLTYLNMVILLGGEVVGVTGLGYIYAAKEREKDEERKKTLGEGRIGVAGVMVNPEIRKKGYAAEALRMVIDYGLREMELLEVTLGTSSKNKDMVDLMKFRFDMPGEREDEDDYGNDMIWRIPRDDWLNKDQKAYADRTKAARG